MSIERHLWQPIAAKFREDIAAGVLAPGTTLKGEIDLAAEWRVSRATVRRALQDLEAQGLITGGQGRRGRQVREDAPIEIHVTRTESRGRADERETAGADAWTSDVRDLGREASQTLAVSLEDATPGVARRLQLEPGALVVARAHLRLIDGIPHNQSTTYYAEALVRDTAIMRPADIPEGVISYMRHRMGIEQTRFRVEFDGRMPSPSEAQEMRIPEGVPLIVEHRTGFDTDGVPVKLTVTKWPANLARLVAEFDG